ncbi:MAG: hypothetical protein EOO89_31195 [Pedobacter sp.]|nr:MAG: hypothetical protein EOO89_31195 [Pedobacter sp.]
MKQKLTLLSVVLSFFFSCTNAETGTETTKEATPAANGKAYLSTRFIGGLDINWIYLGNDGTILYNPVNGIDPVNLAAEIAAAPKNVGTYKMGAKGLSITWKDGKKAEWPIERQNGEISMIDGVLVSLQKGMPANYKLTGTYTARTFFAELSSSSKITFLPDGKFKEASTGTVSTAQTGATAEKEHSGTYTITGNTLRLNYNTGKKYAALIAIMNMGSSKALVLNTSYYPQNK